MSILLDELCPKCGDQLTVRQHYRTGHEFIGCLGYPVCRFTRQIKIDEHGFYEKLKLWIPPSKFCEKCNRTGLLPLILPDGTKSRHAKIFCECRQREADHEYQPHLRPEDIDFPASWSVYRALCREHGWQDPGSDYPPEPELREAQPLFRPRPVAAEIARLKGEVNYLHQKIAELRAKKKTEQNYQPF